MKSIRLSLIIYVWLLLAGGLGAASLFAYHSATHSLRSKIEVNRELLEIRYHDRAQQIREQFDDLLLAKARVIALQVQTQVQWDRVQLTRLVSFGLMNPEQAHLFSPLWFMQSLRNTLTPFTSTVMRRLVAEIQLNETDLPRESESGNAEYFQINSELGISWPPVLSPADERMPFDRDQFDSAKLIDWKFDDITIQGKTARRVQLKVPSHRIRMLFSRRPMGRFEDRPGGGRRPPDERPRGGEDRPGTPRPGEERGFRPGEDRQGFVRPFEERPARSGSDERPGPVRPPEDRAAPTSPWLVVHVAGDAARRDQALETSRDNLRSELAEMEESAQSDLASLRRKLMAISLITFALMTVGGYILVGAGLAPLRRLSQAVSQVSSSDFRLPQEGLEKLPMELAPIQERLQDTLDELRRAFDREKQAAADISHELRTPVASLLTALEVALKKTRSVEEYRETLVDCRDITKQMRQLIERLLSLSRIDAGVVPLRQRSVALADLLADSLSLIRPLASERSIEMTLSCPESLTCQTDPDMLKEVLINLLHNAIQYNRDGGRIEVRAEAAAGGVELAVQDTGVGIPPDQIGHIFERFYRLDPSRHANELHAGLGLSIVQGYMNILGGSIRVESEVGKGSTFRVRLPARSIAA